MGKKRFERSPTHFERRADTFVADSFDLCIMQTKVKNTYIRPEARVLEVTRPLLLTGSPVGAMRDGYGVATTSVWEKEH